MVLRALILVSVFWTEIVKSLPVDDKDMYDTFLSANSKLKSCTNYNVSQLETDIFKGLCSLPSPNIKDYQKQDKITEGMKFNLPPLLCYTIFHNVYAVCHPGTKISVKTEEKVPQSGDQFCENIPPISLPVTCTHWLDDPNHTSEEDCFLVNEVVGAVLNNKDFCKNKCIVPDPDKNVPSSVNPLCEKLLDTSQILVQMAPKGLVAVENQGTNSSSSKIDLTVPPGLTKHDDTKNTDTEEEVEDKDAKDSAAPKSGEEEFDNNMDVVEGNTTVKSEVKVPAVANNKTKVKDDPIKASKIKELELNDKSGTNATFETSEVKVPAVANNKTKVKDDPIKASKIKELELNDKSGTNATFETYSKTNIKSSNNAVEDKSIPSNQSSMTGSDLDVESSGSFTSAFDFDSDSSSSPPVSDQEKEVFETSNTNKEKDKDISKPKAEEKTKPKGEIDAEPLVGEEKKDKTEEKEDKTVDDEATKQEDDSKVEPTLPKAEKEMTEIKYEDNMKTGPEMDERSSFFGYFILLSIVAIIAYLVFHNKQKILALVLEGRRRQGNRRRSGGREYRKLDSNLEDTMDPGRETSLRQVIY